MNRESWTVSQLAAVAGVTRGTIVHRIRHVGGEILATYAASTREGEPATFAPDAAMSILNAGAG